MSPSRESYSPVTVVLPKADLRQQTPDSGKPQRTSPAATTSGGPTSPDRFVVIAGSPRPAAAGGGLFPLNAPGGFGLDPVTDVKKAIFGPNGIQRGASAHSEDAEFREDLAFAAVGWEVVLQTMDALGFDAVRRARVELAFRLAEKRAAAAVAAEAHRRELSQRHLAPGFSPRRQRGTEVEGSVAAALTSPSNSLCSPRSVPRPHGPPPIQSPIHGRKKVFSEPIPARTGTSPKVQSR